VPYGNKETLRQWIAADDEIRALQAQIKSVRERKNMYDSSVGLCVDSNWITLSLKEQVEQLHGQQRTVRPPLRRNAIRTQLLCSSQTSRIG
jgi:seryl-tRNA synthetase